MPTPGSSVERSRLTPRTAMFELTKSPPGSKETFGLRATRSPTSSSAPVSMTFLLKAVMASGVSVMASTRRRAVTVMTSKTASSVASSVICAAVSCAVAAPGRQAPIATPTNSADFHEAAPADFPLSRNVILSTLQFSDKCGQLPASANIRPLFSSHLFNKNEVIFNNYLDPSGPCAQAAWKMVTPLPKCCPIGPLRPGL